MGITEINSENVNEKGSLIPPDVAENIGRLWYRGLTLDSTDGNGISAGIVWEYKNADEDEIDTKSEIIWASGNSKEELNEVLESYHMAIETEQAESSSFELPQSHQDNLLRSALSEDGFEIKDVESRDVYVTVKDLTRLKLKKSKSPFYIKLLGQLEGRQFKNGVVDCLFQGKKGLMEDFAWLNPDWFEQDISSCVLMDGYVKGFLLVHKTPSGILVVELLFSAGIEPKKYLLEMIRTTVRMTIKKYPLDTKILLRRHNSAVHLLVKKLFPGKEGLQAMAGKKQEKTGGMSECSL